ncbi:hypothetical protein ACHAWC_011508 [Mediolabrus comicus]
MDGVYYYRESEVEDDGGEELDVDYPVVVETQHQQQQHRDGSVNNHISGNNNVNNNNNKLLLLPTAAKHPRPPTPFKCGVVFFFHIPSTGGASIANWLRKYARPANGNITFYQKWTKSIETNGSFRVGQDEVQQSFIDGMNEHISNLQPNEWRSGQLHLVNPPLNSTEHLWYQWRSTIENQGCQMINAIMLRDPLNHAMSLYKILHAKNGSREEWMDHLLHPSPTGKWATVLDFFLYNIVGPVGRNPYNVSKEMKVLRGIELLQHHFDVVSLGNHSQFMNEILEYTGWDRLSMPHMNVHKKTLEFTKKEVETLYKLLVQNGDVDFVDAVKQRYGGHLSYLSDLR